MTLISIGGIQLLSASLEQRPAHSGLRFSGVCCPLMQGHCQFLLSFPPSSLCPSYCPVGCLPWSKATLHTPHLGCKFLGSNGNIPKSAAAPSTRLVATPTSCQEVGSRSLRVRWWVMGTDIWWTTSLHSGFPERPSRVGLPSSQIRKHCVSSWLHIQK